MGTPHGGRDKISFADMVVLAAKMTWKKHNDELLTSLRWHSAFTDMIALAANMIWRKPNDEFLNSLIWNSGVLRQQRARFALIMETFSIVCLYEWNPTSKGMVRHQCFASWRLVADALPDHPRELRML